jgi:DNA-binding response OmpR family regulator
MSFLGRTRRVLVIDDDEGVVELIRIILRTRGYDSICAYDGEAGLELLKSEIPDLIICDLRMPKMSGLEFSRRRRELPSRLACIPLLVISSFGGDDNRPDSFWIEGLGCDDFLAKPFEPLALLGRVEALLRSTPQQAYREDDLPKRPATPVPSGSQSDSSLHPAKHHYRRTFTVETESDTLSETTAISPDPVEVVRRSISSGHQDPQWLSELADFGKLDRPTQKGRLLDASKLGAMGDLIEVAVLREEPQASGQVIGYDERYFLRRQGRSWRIQRIEQIRLDQEILGS